MKKKIDKGFTLVELLVVLAIIATVVTITTTSYSATQARSKAAKAQTLGNQATKKAEGWFSVLGIYPTYTQLSSGKINGADVTQTGPVEARIEDTSTLYDASTGVPNDEKRVGYKKCTIGAQVEYYDASSKTIVYLGIAGATSTAACT